MNNDMIPVGTTVHIDPEGIKWKCNGGDLISRSALKKSIKSYADDQYAENEYLGEYAIMDIIDNAPAVEYTFEEAFQKTICDQKLYCPERPRGKWIRKGFEPYGVCSVCGELCEINNFCGNCGADMQKGDVENDIRRSNSVS